MSDTFGTIRYRRYRSHASNRAWSRERRVRNALADACINENLRGTHGPATHGVRCEACAAVHKKSA